MQAKKAQTGSASLQRNAIRKSVRVHQASHKGVQVVLSQCPSAPAQRACKPRGEARCRLRPVPSAEEAIDLPACPSLPLLFCVLTGF